MRSELTNWLDRQAPVQLSMLFNTDTLRRESRFVLAARAGLLVLDPPLSSISTVWEPHDLRVVLTRLIQKGELFVGDELQHVLDVGLYDATLNVLFAGLWNARFDHREGNSTAESIESLVQGSFTAPGFEPLSWVEQDIALFWLTLAKQNGIVDRVVVWVPLDVTSGGDGFVGLHQLILSAERWEGLGCPLRLLVGLVEGARVLEQLEGHPLSERLRENLIGPPPR